MTKVYCKRNDDNRLDFFIKERQGGAYFFLFSQKWYRGVEEYFKDGVPLDEALRHGKTKRDFMVQKVKSKLPVYIRYIERESGIAFLEQNRRFSARAA